MLEVSQSSINYSLSNFVYSDVLRVLKCSHPISMPLLWQIAHCSQCEEVVRNISVLG